MQSSGLDGVPDNAKPGRREAREPRGRAARNGPWEERELLRRHVLDDVRREREHAALDAARDGERRLGRVAVEVAVGEAREPGRTRGVGRVAVHVVLRLIDRELEAGEAGVGGLVLVPLARRGLVLLAL